MHLYYLWCLMTHLLSVPYDKYSHTHEVFDVYSNVTQ